MHLTIADSYLNHHSNSKCNLTLAYSNPTKITKSRKTNWNKWRSYLQGAIPTRFPLETGKETVNFSKAQTHPSSPFRRITSPRHKLGPGGDRPAVGTLMRWPAGCGWTLPTCPTPLVMHDFIPLPLSPALRRHARSSMGASPLAGDLGPLYNHHPSQALTQAQLRYVKGEKRD
jgi:hypothetical protein